MTTPLFPATIQQADNPDWAAAQKVHDWRNYIHENLRGIWHTFTLEQKMAIANNAQITADAELWD